MATAKSIISVAILGDARNITTALGKADAATGGFLKSAAKGFLAFRAVDETFDFLQSSSKEADRLGDAMSRLTTQLGPDFTARLEDTADNFAKIGASSQDMLELEAIFADFGTAAGIADAQIASFAETAAATATAMALLDDQGRDSSAIMDLINKAAGGSEKAARELGVSLLDTKDATVQLANILAQLSPKLDAAANGTGDLEQKQAEMQARIETLQGKIGEQLNPILLDMLTIISDGIEDIDGAIWGFQQLGKAVEDFGRTVLGPLGNVRDVLEDIVNLLPGAQRAVEVPSAFNRRSSVDSVNDFQQRNGTVTIRRKVGTVYD